MDGLKYLPGILSVVLVGLVIAGCSNNASDGTTSEVTPQQQATDAVQKEAETVPPETTAIDALSEDEKEAFDYLVAYSSNLLSPSSLRLGAWGRGTVDEQAEKYFEAQLEDMNLSVGDTFVFGVVTAQNQMGGNTSSVVYESYGKLKIAEGREETALQMQTVFFSELYALPSASVDNVNRALKEYFEEKGY